MTGGRILALNEFDGFRPIICVRGIKDLTAAPGTPYSTVYYGDQLMFAYDTEIPMYLKFLSFQQGLCAYWTQCKNNIDETEEQFVEHFPRLPIVPVKKANLKLVGYGYDPMMRYWVQFEGHAPLFRQDRWWVETDEGDDYDPEWR